MNFNFLLAAVKPKICGNAFFKIFRVAKWDQLNYQVQDIWNPLTQLKQLLPITRICAAEIRLSFKCKHFAFFCIYIEKDIMRISAQKYAWSAKDA